MILIIDLIVNIKEGQNILQHTDSTAQLFFRIGQDNNNNSNNDNLYSTVT